MHGEPVTEGSADDPLAAAFAALVDGPVVRQWMHRDGRRLGWVQSGEGGPTVVLEAGAMSPVASFAAVFQQLAADFHVVAYDRAGYGVSDAAPLTLELQLGDLVAVLDAAGDGPCVVVGHSWGGLLAQVAAWSRPDLIAGLVLVDPAPSPCMTTFRRRLRPSSAAIHLAPSHRETTRARPTSLPRHSRRRRTSPVASAPIRTS